MALFYELRSQLWVWGCTVLKENSNYSKIYQQFFFSVAAYLTFISNLLTYLVALGSKRSILCNNVIGSFPTQPHVFFFLVFFVAVTNAQRIYDIYITTHDE